MTWFKMTRDRMAKSVWHLSRQYTIDKRERAFMKACNADFVVSRPNTPIVVVQCVEDHFFLALFSWVLEEVCRHGSVTVHELVPRSLRPGAANSLGRFLYSLTLYNRLTDRKWINLYRGFCHEVAYRSAAFSFSRVELADFCLAYRVWRNLKSKEDLLACEVQDLPIGDLIYDSYLRFRPAPTVELTDTYLFIVIWQAFRDVRRALKYFSGVKPKVFLTSYGVYIQHGIPVRVALTLGVRVFSFGNYQEFFKELSLDDWTHTRSPDEYREAFSNLSEQQRRLAEADALLAARVAGRLDAATAYMRQSAYANLDEEPPDVRGGMVVFLHDFFDSPHCYQWMLFPDFWEWATTTFRVMRRANVTVFVKPHPNQIAESVQVVDKLKRMHPDVIFLSPRISNRILAEAGIVCAVSVYGTVAHEMAYLGVPSIGAGHSPHIGFGFCRTPRSIDEYESMLLDYGRQTCSKSELRQQSLEFYYMHNLHRTPDVSRLHDIVTKFRTRIIEDDDTLPPADEYIEIKETVMIQHAFLEFGRTLKKVVWQ